LESKDQRRLEEIHLKAQRTIRDRIFIDADIDCDRILNLWTTATEKFQQDLFYIEFRNRFHEIHNLITKAAKEKL
jgi:hypothetical protein